MRQPLRILPFILFAALGLPGAGRAQTGRVFDTMVANKCNKPDSALIKPGTVDTYNAQAKGFNDCLRVYVERENNKIARLRSDASGQFDAIIASATTQIRDIERAINTAIITAGIVNGVSQPSELPPPAEGLASFPAPECAKPDEGLLKPPRGKKAASLASLDTYEAQRQGHDACIRLYIAQAKNQIVQVKANAEAGFLRVADEVNPRIHAINVAVSQALDDAIKASGERNAKAFAFHSPQLASGLGPAQSQPGGVLSSASLYGQQDKPLQKPVFADQPGTETVTVTGARLPRSADMPTGEGDPDAISCRAPQQVEGSHLMGPEVCKRNREWAKLTKNGQNISADGTRIVAGEKQRTYHPQVCVTNFPISQPSVMTTTCGTPGGQ
ncbi:MAG: hypothetical protein H0U98_16440 [Alphaproteobacteria bacterium]|nr:hypothetical protein [Alphaproteobacteria bacterium]